MRSRPTAASREVTRLKALSEKRDAEEEQRRQAEMEERAKQQAETNERFKMLELKLEAFMQAAGNRAPPPPPSPPQD